MRIHQDDPTLILMSIPYGMSYDAGLHTLEQPRIRQWLKNYEKKQIPCRQQKTGWKKNV